MKMPIHVAAHSDVVVRDGKFCMMLSFRETIRGGAGGAGGAFDLPERAAAMAALSGDGIQSADFSKSGQFRFLHCGNVGLKSSMEVKGRMVRWRTISEAISARRPFTKFRPRRRAKLSSRTEVTTLVRCD